MVLTSNKHWKCAQNNQNNLRIQNLDHTWPHRGEMAAGRIWGGGGKKIPNLFLGKTIYCISRFRSQIRWSIQNTNGVFVLYNVFFSGGWAAVRVCRPRSRPKCFSAPSTFETPGMWSNINWMFLSAFSAPIWSYKYPNDTYRHLKFSKKAEKVPYFPLQTRVRGGVWHVW